MKTDLHPALWIEERREGALRGVFSGEPVSCMEDAVPPAFRIDSGTVSSLQLEDAVFAFVDAARRNLGRHLSAETARTLVEAGLGRQALVEFCHLMASLPRHMSVATAECPDDGLQQALIKNLIHHQRHMRSWDTIVERLTGAPVERLSPLASTFALQLGLEELAGHDSLAYVAASGLFGGPGREQDVHRLVVFVETLSGGDRIVNEIVEDWAPRILAHGDSYASVEELREIGYPVAEDFLRLASHSFAPLPWSAVERACGMLRVVDDHFRLFGGGLTICFKENNEPWPRLKIDWLVQ